MKMLYTIFLLVISNIFMSFAWYGHLKFHEMKSTCIKESFTHKPT